jgi:hypothetical protein
MQIKDREKRRRESRKSGFLRVNLGKNANFTRKFHKSQIINRGGWKKLFSELFWDFQNRFLKGRFNR